jgi:hypothetical protein
MSDYGQQINSLAYTDLETRFGPDNARVILRTLEQFEGVIEERVSKLSGDERFKNVLRLMRDNMRTQTRH